MSGAPFRSAGQLARSQDPTAQSEWTPGGAVDRNSVAPDHREVIPSTDRQHSPMTLVSLPSKDATIETSPFDPIPEV